MSLLIALYLLYCPQIRCPPYYTYGIDEIISVAQSSKPYGAVLSPHP